MVSTDESLLKVVTEKVTIFSRLIEGQFPNYEQLIPKETEVEAVVNKTETIEAISQVSLMAQKNMSIKLHVGENEIKISAATAGVGEAKAKVKAKTTGESIQEMAFNAQYLLDGIQGALGEETVLEFTGPVNPGLIKGKNNKDYLYLIMPIRVT